MTNEQLAACRLEQVNVNGVPTFLRITAPYKLMRDSRDQLLEQIERFKKDIGLNVLVMLLPDGWQFDVVADEPAIRTVAEWRRKRGI